MRRALDQVPAARLRGLLDDLRIGEREVRGRDGIEKLAHHEAGALGVLPAQAAQVGRGGLPPVLHAQEPLLPQGEGGAVPSLVRPARVVGSRLEGLFGGFAMQMRPARTARDRASWPAPARISSSCRPGARARCMAQSLQASTTAWGEIPAVIRARFAMALRSRDACGCGSGSARASGPGCAAAGTGGRSGGGMSGAGDSADGSTCGSSDDLL
jgi:hypothetical protein